MAILSVDVGNGYVKAFAVAQKGDGYKIRKNSSGELNQTLMFETIAIPDLRTFRFDPDKRSLPGLYEVSIDGDFHLIGEMAYLHKGQRRWGVGKNHIVEDSYLYCVTAAMDMFDTPDNEILEVTLLLGVPYGIYHDQFSTKGRYESPLAKSLLGKSFHIIHGEREMVVRFKDVRIYAQGAGAYYSNILAVDGSGKSEEAVKMFDSVMIDVGYKTTDVVVYTLNRRQMAIETMEEYSFSMDAGMRNVIEKIPDYLYKHTGIDYTLEEIDEGIRNGTHAVRLGREMVSFEEPLLQGCKGLADTIYGELRRREEKVIKQYPYLFISGGGSSHVYPYLHTKERMPLLEIIPGDPCFANARGYVSWYQLEERIAKNRAKAKEEQAKIKTESENKE